MFWKVLYFAALVTIVASHHNDNHQQHGYGNYHGQGHGSHGHDYGHHGHNDEHYGHNHGHHGQDYGHHGQDYGHYGSGGHHGHGHDNHDYHGHGNTHHHNFENQGQGGHGFEAHLSFGQGNYGGSSYDHGGSHGHSSQYVNRHGSYGKESKIDLKDKDDQQHHDVEQNEPSMYEFGYNVEDMNTQDIKSQHETRDGDVVKGYYELKEPNGSMRKVEYHADKKTGFQASVKHETHHIVPEKLHH